MSYPARAEGLVNSTKCHCIRVVSLLFHFPKPGDIHREICCFEPESQSCGDTNKFSDWCAVFNWSCTVDPLPYHGLLGLLRRKNCISLTCFCRSATASLKYLVMIFGLSSGFILSPNDAKMVSAYFASSSSDSSSHWSEERTYLWL